MLLSLLSFKLENNLFNIILQFQPCSTTLQTNRSSNNKKQQKQIVSSKVTPRPTSSCSDRSVNMVASYQAIPRALCVNAACMAVMTTRSCSIVKNSRGGKDLAPNLNPYQNISCNTWKTLISMCIYLMTQWNFLTLLL